MSGSSMFCKISKIANHVENQGKRVRELERAANHSAPGFADDDEYTNILGDSNQNNKSLGCQTHVSKSPKN